jgi:RNA recognition motif-containing protein
LYVKNLPDYLIKDEELKKFFEDKIKDLEGKRGRVMNARVYTQETGEKDQIGNPIIKGKGYGFVCFESMIVAAKVAAMKP